MNRRSFFKKLAVAPLFLAAANAQTVPQDREWYDRFQNFCETMNKFILKLNQKVFDSKLWAKATDQFRKLERLDGR